MTFRRLTTLGLFAALVPAYIVACEADPGDAPKVANAVTTTSVNVPSSSSSTSTGPSGSYTGPTNSSTSQSTGVRSTASTPMMSTGSSSTALSSSSTSSSAPACTTCTLAVKYKVGQVGSSPTLSFDVQVTNTGTGAQDPSQLTILYYFTADGITGIMGSVNSASISSKNPPYYTSIMAATTQTFTALTPATATADTYDQIAFGTVAGAMLGPGDVLEADVQFFSPGHTGGTFNQANDYSYDATATGFTATNTITVYVAGTLAAGTPPM